jgi:hypothetical protein
MGGPGWNHQAFLAREASRLLFLLLDKEREDIEAAEPPTAHEDIQGHIVTNDARIRDLLAWLNVKPDEVQRMAANAGEWGLYGRVVHAYWENRDACTRRGWEEFRDLLVWEEERKRRRAGKGSEK